MSAKVIVGLVLTAFLLSLLPLTLIARSRNSRSTGRPFHLVLDMDKQPRFNPQAGSAMMSDGRAMRGQIEGTVAREDLDLQKESLTVSVGIPKVVGNKAGDDKAAEFARTLRPNSQEEYAHLMWGRVRPAGMSDEKFNEIKPPSDKDLVSGTQTFYATSFPRGLEASAELMARGRERYNIYCLPCHGETGYGDGLVHQAALKLGTTNAAAVSMWTAPANLTDEKFTKQPLGRLYNTITNGFANMPAHDKQISVPDRWAIVLYLKALQESQGKTAAK